MKKRIIFLLIVMMFYGSGCDIIMEGDRLIPVSNESAGNKKVLLIEFTDQNCSNCLNATAEIYKMMEYFSDTIIVVSIHANPLPFPLVTREGNDYERYYQAEDHPAGIIDGGIGGKYMSHDPQTWAGFILERLKVEPVINIDMEVNYNETSKEATVKVKLSGNEALSENKLQLWISENNVKQWQLMLDGTRNNDYIHNHVFRASINGTWGESFSIGANETKDFSYSTTLNANWKSEDISITGFVYDPVTNEIFNVQEIKLINK